MVVLLTMVRLSCVIFDRGDGCHGDGGRGDGGYDDDEGAALAVSFSVISGE